MRAARALPASSSCQRSATSSADAQVLGALARLAPVRPDGSRGLRHLLALAADRALEDDARGLRRRGRASVRVPQLLGRGRRARRARDRLGPAPGPPPPPAWGPGPPGPRARRDSPRSDPETTSPPTGART